MGVHLIERDVLCWRIHVVTSIAWEPIDARDLSDTKRERESTGDRAKIGEIG